MANATSRQIRVIGDVGWEIFLAPNESVTDEITLKRHTCWVGAPLVHRLIEHALDGDALAQSPFDTTALKAQLLHRCGERVSVVDYHPRNSSAGREAGKVLRVKQSLRARAAATPSPASVLTPDSPNPADAAGLWWIDTKEGAYPPCRSGQADPTRGRWINS